MGFCFFSRYDILCSNRRADQLGKLTKLDQAIIHHLNRDARLSSAELARTLDVAERTIHYRLSRLIAADIIKPVAIVNRQAFGYDLVVDILCEIEISQQEAIVAAVVAMPEVSYVAYSTGDQDLSFQAFFRDPLEMHDFITNRVHQLSGIRRTRTVLVPRIVKDSYQWLPPDSAFEL
jgi:DNA-binding Lrp family transcriptional regulator